MNKKKTINLIFILLLTAVCSCLTIWYLVNPDSFVYYRDVIWTYLNQPLPVVGVSIITVGTFVVFVIKNIDIGKKGLEELKKQHELAMKEKDEFLAAKDEYIKELEQYKQAVLDNKETINKIIDILPNKKLKELKHEENNEREN